MLPLYRIPSNRYKRRQRIPNTNLDNISHREHDLKRLRSTPNDLKRPQKMDFNIPVSNADSTVNHTTNKKNKLKRGYLHEVCEINDEILDEILHNINL